MLEAMNRGAIYLGHIGKVPVYVEVWAVALLYLVWIAGHADLSQYLLDVVALLLTILLHELGHALVAQALRLEGVAITISAMGGFCSYFSQPTAGQKALVTAAGPMTNFGLAGATYLLLQHVPIAQPDFFYVLKQFFTWNLILGLFNSVPLFPLDGGQLTLALSQLMFRRDTTARSVTLGISVASACGLAAASVAWFGRFDLFYLGFIAFLLMIAWASLH